jgi:DNA-binding beta-propeller fold protein YncE
MKRAIHYSQAFLLFVLFLCCSLITGNDTQLKLDKVIPLPNIKGKIESIAINEDQQIVYLAILGNNSLIAVNLQTGQIIPAILELNEPQGVAYIPENHTIVVTNAGDGKCTLYNDSNYSEIKSISLNYDADQMRYYPFMHKIFVGYGDGGISAIGADSFNVLFDVKLPAHPASFQVDEKAQKLFINVPIAKKIFVVDLNTLSIIARWSPQAVSNYPMALDTAHHRLFIACRKPSKLEVFDTESGNIIYSLNCSDDPNDIFYNPERKEIYVSCGEGFIDVIKQNDANHYDNVAKIPTRAGTRTSLFVPGLNELLVALPAALGKDAELRIYKLAPLPNLAKK